MRFYEFDIISEAPALPGDTSTLLSLLSEMVNMLGAGGPTKDLGPMRSAIIQLYNNGSADDSSDFTKQINFRTGSIRATWMGKNWPQLKNCFLRLKKNPRYQNSINMLDELGNWPVMLIKDEKTPSLSKYFTAILSMSPYILKDIAKFESEEHVRQRAKHLSALIPEKIREYNQFVNHWVTEYSDDIPAAKTSKPKDELKGQQAALGQNIVDQVLGAIPKDLAKQLRPQVQRMGSQNDKLMFIMKALQDAGIDPSSVLK